MAVEGLEFTVEGRRAVINLQRYPLKAIEAIRGVFLEGAADIRNEIILSMTNTPKTGRRYRRGKKFHIASSPGNPPARDSGQYVSRMIIDESFDKVEVGAEVVGRTGYGRFLEEGTKRMKARPHFEPAIDKVAPSIENNLRKALINAGER